MRRLSSTVSSGNTSRPSGTCTMPARTIASGEWPWMSWPRNFTCPLSGAMMPEMVFSVESNYGPVQALRGVSLSVAEGKIVTVLGANGAGKTTTLKTISGIIEPLKGQVKFRGRDIQGHSPDAIVRAGIVHVPEGREVFPLLTVEDNLRMGASTRRDADGVARDLEAVFGYFPILRERASQEAGQLSGGQQQMLAIARALLARP